METIRRGIARAGQYEITTQTDVARFIEYSVVYGPNFDKRLEWVAAVLRTSGINGRQKMDRIDNRAPFERPPALAE